MLEGLDDVPWSRLQHAYGDASDVPGLLRALVSRSADDRKKAWRALYGNIWHQGTVYEATAFAVPFLIELAADEATPERFEVVSYLGTLADGSSYIDAHRTLDPDAGVDEEALKQELQWVRAAREAVHSGEPLYRSLLNDTSFELCAAAAFVLSRFPENAETVGEDLRDRWKTATETRLRVALAYLSVPFARVSSAHREWLVRAAEIESDDQVRWTLCAATALVSPDKYPTVKDTLLAGAIPGELRTMFEDHPFYTPEIDHFYADAVCSSEVGQSHAVRLFDRLVAESNDSFAKHTRYILADRIESREQ